MTFASISSAFISTCALSDLLTVLPLDPCSTSLPLLKAETPCFTNFGGVWSSPCWSQDSTTTKPPYKVSSSGWFCSVRLYSSLCGSLLAVYTRVMGIVYSELCTTLVCNTCWVDWEHYISHYFKITNNLELSALIKMWVYRKSWHPLKLCVDLGIMHNATALILIF